MIASREAVLAGLRQACQDRLIGLGRGVNLNNLQKKWCGEEVLLDPNEEGLWIIPPFAPEPEPKPDGDDKKPEEEREKREIGEEDQGREEPEVIEGSGPRKGVHRLTLRGDVALDSWSEVFRCFVSPAARMNLKRLRLGIDFEMEAQEGQPWDEKDPTLQAMKESARQLGLKLKEEEG
jgi:hypothetical protein